jgi:acetyl esterase/lipase
VDAVILDPEIEARLDQVPAFDLSPDVLDVIRSMRHDVIISLQGQLSDTVVRENRPIGNDPAVFVRVHQPIAATDALRPAVFSMHGGGYVLGSAEMDDLRFDRWCNRFDCVGVSVEYRLAPETPFPGPLDDCYAGLRWTWENADRLGIDRNRIGIAGASAGGGLAAALALLARDRGEIDLAFQLLECPMIDDRQVTSSSRLDGLPVWSRISNTFGWQCYLGDLHGADHITPYAAAARAVDLRGLPPTLLIVGGADGFRDENVDYASRLTQAGVPTELHVLPGAPHGLLLFGGSRLAAEWARLVEGWLERQVGSR